MRVSKSAFITLTASMALLAASAQARAQSDVSFTLKYGVLAGLTGDPASSGQAWNQATKVGIEQIQQAIARSGLKGVEVVLADSQDSQGSPQAGVEAAQHAVEAEHHVDAADLVAGVA